MTTPTQRPPEATHRAHDAKEGPPFAAKVVLFLSAINTVEGFTDCAFCSCFMLRIRRRGLEPLGGRG